MIKKIRKQFKPLKKRLYYKGLVITKEFIHGIRTDRYDNKRIAFIIGCQRSGTTLMYEIFQKDMDAKVYGEFSPLSDPGDYERLRLRPYDQVKNIFARQPVPLIISKPLVETQNADKLINYFDNAKIIWMFRYYKSVAHSNIQHFGKENGIKDLRPIVKGDQYNWRSENISDYTRAIVQRYFSEDMNPYDAAALFWFARNRLFYELNLEGLNKVYICKYENLVSHPLEEMKKMYNFLNVSFPGEHIVAGVHTEAVKKGKEISLSPEIDSLCQELYEKLEGSYQKKIFNLVA